MKLQYNKKKMKQSTLIRGYDGGEMAEAIEDFWQRVDDLCDRKDKYYRKTGRYYSIYYWFDKNTGDSYVGRDMKKGSINRPKGPGVIY